MNAPSNPARRAAFYLTTIAIMGTVSGGIAATELLDITWQGGLTVTTSVIVLCAGKGLFRTRMVPDLSSIVSHVFAAGGLGALVGFGIIAATPIEDPSLGSAMLLAGAVILGALIGQQVGSTVLRRAWKRGQLRSRVLIIGVGRLAQELAVEINARPTYGVDVLGFVTAGLAHDDHNASPVLGSLYNIDEVAREHRADRVILAPIGVLGPGLISSIRKASSAGLSVFVVPRLYEMGLGLDSLSPDRVRGYPLVRLQRAAYPRLGALLKRGFDILVSGLGLLLASPIILVAAIGVRLSDRGDVLFRQERVGQHDKSFELLKLRTMRPSKSSDTQWLAEDRVTGWGSLLRRTAIDELPQLYNVLRGDMSLVGPRPERPAFVEHFESRIPGYVDRHRMPAGLTGLAQIVGLRGNTSIAERIKYDNIYIDQWSFWSDIQILFKTLFAVLRQGSLFEEHVELSIALEDISVPETAVDH